MAEISVSIKNWDPVDIPMFLFVVVLQSTIA